MGAVLCLVSQSCPILCNPMDCNPPGSSVLGDSPGKNTGVGCHAFLQGIFPNQGLNPGLSHCRLILYQLSYQGSPVDCGYHLLKWNGRQGGQVLLREGIGMFVRIQTERASMQFDIDFLVKSEIMNRSINRRAVRIYLILKVTVDANTSGRWCRQRKNKVQGLSPGALLAQGPGWGRKAKKGDVEGAAEGGYSEIWFIHAKEELV